MKKISCILYSNSQDVVVNRFDSLLGALLYFYNEVKDYPDSASDLSICIDAHRLGVADGDK